jgi:hypothetical protein
VPAIVVFLLLVMSHGMAGPRVARSQSMGTLTRLSTDAMAQEPGGQAEAMFQAGNHEKALKLYKQAKK